MAMSFQKKSVDFQLSPNSGKCHIPLYSPTWYECVIRDNMIILRMSESFVWYIAKKQEKKTV